MIISDFLELYFVYEYININNVIEDTLTAVTEYKRFPSQVKKCWRHTWGWAVTKHWRDLMAF